MTARLRIHVLDAGGAPLADRGDIEVYDHATDRLVALRRDRSLGVRFNVDVEPGQLYRLRVFPSRHRPVGRFVRAPAGGTRRVDVACPVDPRRVSAVEFPAWSELPPELRSVLEASAVEGLAASGERLYEALDTLPRAGLLNVFAKMRSERLPNGRSTWSYVLGLYRIRADRVFADVQLDFRDAIKNAVTAGLFDPVDGALHTPPPGFVLADSFKSPDAFGNLQLTFFASAAAPLRFRVDADIDDASGIAHVFDVIRHFLTDSGTHPFDIHEILVARQQIDPGYVLRA